MAISIADHYIKPLHYFQQASDFTAYGLYLGWRNPPQHTYTHLAACYAQLDQMTESHNAFMTYEREKPDDADFPRYAAVHFEVCMRPEDAEHWMVGYRKAGNPTSQPHGNFQFW